MIDFWEVMERSDKGERMEETDYDMFLYTHVSDLIKKYDIRFDQNEIVSSDDALADRTYEAALELFKQVGFYNLDTMRIARFTRDEIEDALSNAPSSYVWGDGRDQRITVAR